MKFLDSLSVLMRAFPKWDLPRDAVPTWAALLSDVPAADLHTAALDIARTSKFPPSIAEWRERAEVLAGNGAAGAFGASEAWAELLRNRALSQRQRYESRPEKRVPPTWTNEAARLAAECVSWSGDWEAETPGTVRAQFERYYRELCAKGNAIERARHALEFAPQVEALLERPILRRVEG